MSPRQDGPRPPRVVAELGRPETPDETAARKAEASRRRRANQTAVNLGLSLAASLVVVLVLVLVVARDDTSRIETVDVRAVAAQAAGSVDVPLVAPVLPGWSANSAEVRRGGADGVTSWYVGYLTAGDEFIALDQGVDANPTWVGQQVADARVTSTRDLGGLTWDVRDRRDARDPGNVAYALSTTVDRSTYVLYGTADDAEFTQLAEAVAAEATTEGDAS